MPQEGGFILKNKHPEAERTAVRRVGSEDEWSVYEEGRKKKASATERKLSKVIADTLLPKWLQKLEHQITTNTGVKHSLFFRWAHRNGAITSTLSDGEYLRIAAGETEPKSRESVLEGLQNEQLAGYDQWLNYLLINDGRREYEPWFRYLILSEITKRDDRGRRRDPETTSGVLPLSMSALARVRDDFTSLIQEYEFQSTMANAAHASEDRKALGEEKTAALNALTSYPFHEKYVGYIAEEAREENERLNYTNGWHTITDAKELAHVSRGTPWCLAGLTVAQGYLEDEDAKLRVFFEDGRPKIAAHVVGGEVYEVRGVDDSQNLDPKYFDEVTAELAQYENADTWQQQATDMRMLGEIAVRVAEDPEVPLSKEQLRFLYEVDRPIQSFGYERDERIETIVENRMAEEDALVIFDCEDKSEIATSLEDINASTKLWDNGLSPGVVEKLMAYGVENVYAAFPKGRILLSQVSFPVERERASYIQEIIKDVPASEVATAMIKSRDFARSLHLLPKDLIFVEASPPAIGINRYATMKEIMLSAREAGLEPVPAAAVPGFLLSQPNHTKDLYICMEPIRLEDKSKSLATFVIEPILHDRPYCLLDRTPVYTSVDYSSNTRVLFAVRLPERIHP